MNSLSSVTTAQADVLQALMDAGQATCGDLMDDTHYSRAWTMQALRALSGNSLVRRLAMRDCDGAVAWHYSLTPQGISHALQAAAVH